jgi:hypothetical protein
MNVHPSAVVNPPGPTTREPFAPEALYELKIDTNGDAVADIVGCASRPSRRKPQHCAASRERRPPEPMMAGRSSSKQHPSRRVATHA